MTPQLRAKRAQFEEIRSRVTAVMDTAKAENRDLTDAESDDLRAQAEKLRALGAEIEEMTEHENREADVQELAAKLDGALGGQDRSDVPSLMPSPARLDQMRQAGGFGTSMRFTTTEPADHHRAAVTIGTHLGVPTIPAPARRSQEPRRLAVVAGLSTTNVQGMATVRFPVFGDADAAAIVAEGAAKPEYDDITNDDITPLKIALWTDFTLEAQITYPDFERRLRQKLAQQVAKREDQLLLATLLAAGIPTQAASADPMAEQLLSAVGTVTSAFGEPSLILVNPGDLGSIFGGGLGYTSPGELTSLNLTLWGAKVYPTDAISAGTAIVGNFRDGASLLVGMPPTYKVDPFTQMKTNKITVMLEEAVNLLVDEPTAFLSVDLVV